MIKGKAKANLFGKMAASMMVCGKMENRMVKENSSLRTMSKE